MQKKNFKNFSCWVRGVHSTTFDPKLRNERFTLIFFMGFQICIFNTKNSKLTFSNGPQLMEKRFMANCHASLDSTCKRRISKLSHLVTGGSFHNFDPKLRNERFTLISFMQFLAILSALQSFQICIFDRKNSISTFSNGPQLMEKRFMANLHTLDSTCKSRISKISHVGGHSTTFDP